MSGEMNSLVFTPSMKQFFFPWPDYIQSQYEVYSRELKIYNSGRKSWARHRALQRVVRGGPRRVEGQSSTAESLAALEERVGVRDRPSGGIKNKNKLPFTSKRGAQS